ncbi:beta strand repeat-containing protein, partial [Dyella choica]
MTNSSLNQSVLQIIQQGLDISGNSQANQAYNDLISYIDNDPALIAQLNNDVGANLVKSFAWSSQAGSGAYFDSSNGSLNININQLLQQAAYAVGSYNEAFVVAHELGHSEFQVSNPTGITPGQANNSFWSSVNQTINSGAQDFTSAIQAIQANSNYNESYAQIQGFNAELSEYYAAHSIVNPTASDASNAYKALAGMSGYSSYFLQSDGTLRSGLTSNNDGSLAETLSNMGSEGDYYYLKPSNLGIFEDKDYTNYYGTGELGAIIDGYLGNSSSYKVSGSQITVTPTAQINFGDASLSNSGTGSFNRGFDPNQLAQDLGSSLIPLPNGATSVSFTVKDTSTGTSYVYTWNNGVSSVATTVSGSTPLVFIGQTGKDPNLDLQTTTSNSVVTIAAGYGGEVDGSNNTDILGNGSSLVTSSGSTNNTVTCGSSIATINGASAEKCLIPQTGSPQLTVDGSGLTGNLQGNVVLTESGDTFSAGSNANINMASGDVINVGTGTSGVQLTCGNATETVGGGATGAGSVQCTITNGSGAFSYSGSALSITPTGSGQSISLSGTGYDVTSTGNNVSLLGAGSSATVNGVNAIAMQGPNQSLNLGTSGSTVNTNTGDTGEALSGSGFTLNGTAGQFTGTAMGSNDIFNLSANSNSSLTCSGTSNSIFSAGNNLSLLGANSSAAVTGVNTVNMSGTNQSLTLDTNGGTVDTSAGDTGETLNGSGFTLNATGLFSGSTSGTGDTFNLATNSGSTLSIAGTSDVANSIGNTIQLNGASSAATVAGADTVDLEANGQTLTLSSSGDTVNALSGDTYEVVDGSGAQVNAGTGVFTFNGNNDTISDTGANSTMNVTGTGDTFGMSSGTIYGSNNDLFTVNGSGNTIENGTASVTNVTGSNNTVSYDGANSTVNVIGTGDTLDMSSETVYGSNNDLFTVNGSGNTIENGTASVTNVTGSNNTVSYDGANSTVNVIGTGDALDMSSGTVYGSNNDLFTVNGSGNTIENGTASVTNVTGSNNTVSYDGANSTVNVIGTGDTLDMSSETVYGSNNDLFTVNGSGNTIENGTASVTNVTGSNNTVSYDGANSTVNVIGTGDTLDMSSETVYGSNNDLFTVNGSGNTIEN